MQHFGKQAQVLATDMRSGCVGVRIGRTHRLVTRIFEQALRPTGLTLPQLELLSTLTIVGRPVKPAELAELTGVERSTMSRNLAVMQDNGWVTSTDVSPTGRAMTVSISAAGTRRLAGARGAWEAAQRQALAALGAEAPTTLDGWIASLVAPGP